MGSRNSQTTIYWNSELTQVICGCFKGDLEQFEATVKETHGDNLHGKSYIKWIESVKQYICTTSL